MKKNRQKEGRLREKRRKFIERRRHMEKTASWKIMERQMAREGWNAENEKEFRSIEGEVNYKVREK